jgi:5-methylcytosine-specific restriction endonuclease McrA
MNNRRDRSLLLSAARDLRDELEARSHGGAFHPKGKIKTIKTWTDGWLVRIGNTNPIGLRVELWFDRYPTTESRRFYYGFFTTKPENMCSLQKKLRAHLRPIRALRRRDYDKSSPGVWLLNKPLRRDEYDRPIYEHYEYGKKTNYYFYGLYVPTEKNSGDNVSRMVKRAADFFSEVMWLLPKQSKAEAKTKVYPQLERSVVRKHLVRERSPELAKACKRRDGYRCKVCDMTFAEVYGEELGAEFAEAHHLHPLSKKRAEEKTRLEHLVTVCSNCHRMLHQMRGDEHDLDRLRRAINDQRRRR